MNNSTLRLLSLIVEATPPAPFNVKLHTLHGPMDDRRTDGCSLFFFFIFFNSLLLFIKYRLLSTF